MSSITINGKTINTGGNDVYSVNVSVDGNVVINGKPYTTGDFTPERIVNIVVNGSVDVASTLSGNLTVHGDVSGGAKSTSGNVTVDGDVNGNSTSMSGDVKVGRNVSGNASSMSGNVKVGKKS